MPIKNKNRKSKLRGGLFHSTLEQRPRVINEIIRDYGDRRVKRCVVFRKPITKAFRSIADHIESAKKILDERGYDYLFHLFADLYLDDGEVIGFEKNARVDAVLGGFNRAGAEMIEAQVNNPITIRELFENMEQKYGGNQLYVYRSLSTNCQDFISKILKELDAYTPEVKDFVYQYVKDLVNSTTNKILNVITDIAGFGSYLQTGGKKKRRKYKSTNNWHMKVMNYYHSHPGITLRDAMIASSKSRHKR